MNRLEVANEIVGHNIISFDIPAIQKIYPWFQPKGKVTDTLVCSRLIWTDLMARDIKSKTKKTLLEHKLVGRHSLKAWGYRLGVLKGSFGETTDWSEYTEEMGEYCKQDVEVTVALLDLINNKNYSEEALKLEHEFATIIDKMTKHGWEFDVEAAGKLLVEIEQQKIPLLDELQEVFPPVEIVMKTPQYWRAGRPVKEGDAGIWKTYPTKGAAKKDGWKDSQITRGPNKIKSIPFNPNSGDQVAGRLIDRYGWEPVVLTEKGKASVTSDVLETLSYPEAKLLARYALLSKLTGMIANGKGAWLKYEENNRIHSYVNHNGAVTGRCTHSKPAIACIPKVGSAYGTECRSLFKVSKGRVLVGADASGIELRNLAHYMAPYDFGDYVRVILEGDVHTTNQRAAGLTTRDQAKTFIYALNYGAGDGKIGSIIGGSESEGLSLRLKFLKNLPALDELLKKLKTSLGFVPKKYKGKVYWRRPKGYTGRQYLKGLDGRHIYVEKPHVALNYLLQSAGAVIMKKATVILFNKLINQGLIWGTDFAFVGHIHDEIQTECKEQYARTIGEAAVASIKEAGEYFNFRCPLDGEWKVGSNWAETH